MSMETINAGCRMHNAKERLARSRAAVFALCLLPVAFLTACSTEAENTPAPPPPVRVGAENVVTVAAGTVVVGPIISGELRVPEHLGDLE